MAASAFAVNAERVAHSGRRTDAPVCSLARRSD